MILVKFFNNSNSVKITGCFIDYKNPYVILLRSFWPKDPNEWKSGSVPMIDDYHLLEEHIIIHGTANYINVMPKESDIICLQPRS